MLIHIEIDPTSISALTAAIIALRGMFIGFRARSRRNSQARLSIDAHGALEAPPQALSTKTDKPPRDAAFAATPHPEAGG
jgi:hypothetical protein